ncbi:MAG: amidase [Proteobacteria bacterium]|nr:amidase [Pseudomonadota bacterium]
MNRVDLDATATELVAALAARKVSSLELTDAAIARIEARDGPINAVVVRDFDRAREAARAADAALARGETGALLGLPMTVKESHNVAGLPTTWGSPVFGPFVASEDSVGVGRLKAAGAVILGKTNIPPFLSDWQSNNPIYGRTRNPWNLERSPGGSSGGAAAALAAGMAPLEYGSDIGGSIRVPAHFCGVFGHKPSYNLIPTRGHEPPNTPPGAGVVLAVVGPLARSAADLSRAMEVLAGPGEFEDRGYRLALRPARHDRLADHRVLLIDEHPAAPVSQEIRAGLQGLADGLAGLGAAVARGSALIPDLAKSQELYGSLLMTAMSRGQPGAQSISAHEWMGLLDAQAQLRRQWAALFESFDVVLAPASSTAAFPHDDNPDFNARTLMVDGEPSPYFLQVGWSGIATVANLPATAIPVGQTRDGLPFGAQVIGPYLEDRTTLAFAELVEREFGGFRRPPGF